MVLFDSLLIQGFTNGLGPVELAATDDHLARPVEDPFRACFVLIIIQGLLDNLTQALFHDSLYLAHPVLHIASGIDILAKVHVFVLGRVHSADAHVRFELDLVDVLEAFAQMRLDCLWILGLRQDLEQLVV